MKKLFIFLMMAIPFATFAQYNVEVINSQPKDLEVEVKGYNNGITSAVMNLKFEFDEETEMLVVRMGSTQNNRSEYNGVWLPIHAFSYGEMDSYMKSRGVKMKKSSTYTNQDNFLNLSSQSSQTCVSAEGMGLVGDYALKSNLKPRKIKMLDHQIAPIEGNSELDLNFKVVGHAKTVKLTMHNPITVKRSGSKATIGYVGDDIDITINLVRDCKNYTEMLKTIQEYEEIFVLGEEKVNELNRSSRALMGKVRDMLLEMFDQIDDKRFDDTGCEQIQDSYDEILAIIERLEQSKVEKPKAESKDKSSSCDIKALNAEIKSTTTKLNNMVNDWSLAGDAGTKAEKKAAFQSAVSAFDAKLNGLPSGCKAKLDSKLLKNYEFVKKLVK